MPADPADDVNRWIVFCRSDSTGAHLDTHSLSLPYAEGEARSANAVAIYLGLSRLVLEAVSSFDPRQCLGHQGSESRWGKRIDRADIDLAKNVTVRPVHRLRTVEEISVPEHG